MFQWDDLRFFLAVATTGNASRAARKLGVNQSTVSRRLAALEAALDLTLFTRTASGLVPTPDGVEVRSYAERIERLTLEMDRRLTAARDRVEGVVRVTTVEEIASSIAGQLAAFRRHYPHIEVQLLPGLRNFDLARGEADVALRLARPTEGDLVARKVGGFGYAVFASKAYLDGLDEDTLGKPERMDWVLLDASSGGDPSMQWFQRTYPGVRPVMRAGSYKPLVSAVLAGLGVSPLPRPYRHMYEGLVPLPIDISDLRREIWLVVHRDMRRVRAVTAVASFLEEVMQRPWKPDREPPTSL